MSTIAQGNRRSIRARTGVIAYNKTSAALERAVPQEYRIGNLGSAGLCRIH